MSAVRKRPDPAEPGLGRGQRAENVGRLPAEPHHRLTYFLLACVLFMAYAFQDVTGLHWHWLGELQKSDLYKQISGFGLLGYIAQQWHLSVLRSRGLTRTAGRRLRRHQLFGALAPLFLYAHAQTMGFAYQQMLSGVFFGVFMSGLLNLEIVRIRRPWFRPLWITAHVGLSTLLLVLLGYHLFVSYAYQ